MNVSALKAYLKQVTGFPMLPKRVEHIGRGPGWLLCCRTEVSFPASFPNRAPISADVILGKKLSSGSYFYFLTLKEMEAVLVGGGQKSLALYEQGWHYNARGYFWLLLKYWVRNPHSSCGYMPTLHVFSTNHVSEILREWKISRTRLQIIDPDATHHPGEIYHRRDQFVRVLPLVEYVSLSESQLGIPKSFITEGLGP